MTHQMIPPRLVDAVQRGMMSPADFSKLAGIAALATVSPITQFYEDHASTTYSIGSDPTSDTTIKKNDGSTAMSITVVVPSTKVVWLHFFARIDKAIASSGRTRGQIYDGGSVILPDVGGRAAFNSIPIVDNEQHLVIDGFVSLASGSHTLTIKHQATYTTTAIAFWERYVFAVVL